MEQYKYFSNYKLNFPIEISDWEQIDDVKKADALFLDKATSEDQALKYHSQNPLAPIVFIGKNNSFREFHIDSDKKWNIEQVIDQIIPIIQRKSQLPADVLSNLKGESGTRDPLLTALAFIWTRDGKIEPTFSSEFKGGYAYAFKDVHYNTAKTLDRLREFKYIDAEPVDSAYGCPKCHSVQVLLRDSCPTCQSTNIVEEAAIHHFKCSYLGPESDFSDRYGNYICPKCNKTLAQIGLDYDKPTEIAKCNNCNEDNFDPIVSGRCLSCDNRFAINQAEHNTIYNCILNERGKEALFKNEVYKYDPNKILSDKVSIIDKSLFKYLTDIFADLQKRYSFNSTILKINIEVELNDLTDYQRMDIFSTLGKELFNLVRSSDAISVLYNSVFVLLPGTNIEKSKVVVSRLKESIDKILDQNLSSKVKIYLLSVETLNEEKKK